jgi:hypothetical protein
LRLQTRKRGPRRGQPEFTQVADDTIIGSTVWAAEDGRRVERFQVITVRDGKIVDLQGCASLRAAERFARRPR